MKFALGVLLGAAFSIVALSQVQPPAGAGVTPAPARAAAEPAHPIATADARLEGTAERRWPEG